MWEHLPDQTFASCVDSFGTTELQQNFSKNQSNSNRTQSSYEKSAEEKPNESRRTEPSNQQSNEGRLTAFFPRLRFPKN
jgi:hypothetical protein